MATAATSNICLLCTEQCKKPTNLPNCGHIFCNPCLKTYACIYDNNDTTDGLMCPECGADIDKPKDIDTETWIDTLSADMVITEDKPSNSKERENVSQSIECASCKSLGRSEKGVKYCLNCMECLCKLCLKIRHSFQPMRHHELLDIDNAHDEGDDDLYLLQKMSGLVACSSHPNETIMFHCLDEDTFCCTICVVADHRKCNNVVEIETQTLGVEFKSEVAHLTYSVSNALHIKKEIIEKLKTSHEAQDKQAINIAEQITAMKKKISQLLDAFEIKCNETAKASARAEKMKIQNEKERVKSEADSLEMHAKLMMKTSEYGSACHQYIAKVRCHEKLKQFEALLEETTSDFQSINVSFHQTKLLDELLNVDQNDTDMLGSIVENPDKPLESVYNTNTKLERCSFTKTGEKETKENYTCKYPPTYSSVAFLPNNQLVLLDSYNDSGHCLLASEDGTVLSSCDFVSCGATSNQTPYCITVTQPDGMIAVSLPEQRLICFVTAQNGQLKVTDKFIQTKYEPGAIYGLKNGDIAVAWMDPVAFGVININATRADAIDKVYFCHDKAGRSLKSFDHMAVDEERSHVIQPCTEDKAVYCFDLNGNPKFKYTIPELNNPRGIAVDRDGNVYVCDYDYDAPCIYVISPTGSASRLIKDDSLGYLLAIAFNKDGDSFAVTNAYRSITIFRVQRQ